MKTSLSFQSLLVCVSVHSVLSYHCGPASVSRRWTVRAAAGPEKPISRRSGLAAIATALAVSTATVSPTVTVAAE